MITSSNEKASCEFDYQLNESWLNDRVGDFLVNWVDQSSLLAFKVDVKQDTLTNITVLVSELAQKLLRARSVVYTYRDKFRLDNVEDNDILIVNNEEFTICDLSEDDPLRQWIEEILPREDGPKVIVVAGPGATKPVITTGSWLHVHSDRGLAANISKDGVDILGHPPKLEDAVSIYRQRQNLAKQIFSSIDYKRFSPTVDLLGLPINLFEAEVSVMVRRGQEGLPPKFPYFIEEWKDRGGAIAFIRTHYGHLISLQNPEKNYLYLDQLKSIHPMQSHENCGTPNWGCDLYRELDKQCLREGKKMKEVVPTISDRTVKLAQRAKDASMTKKSVKQLGNRLITISRYL